MTWYYVNLKHSRLLTSIYLEDPNSYSLICRYVHLSAGDLLRAEQKTDSKDSELIRDYIKEGKIVPVEITCRLLHRAMEHAGMDKKFLIDGFPRNQDNLDGWNTEMTGHAKVEQVLFFDVPEEIMLSRIMKRSETSGRTDDNEEAAKKRFKTFRDETMPIVRHFEGLSLLLRINADQGVEDVYKEVTEGLVA